MFPGIARNLLGAMYFRIVIVGLRISLKYLNHAYSGRWKLLLVETKLLNSELPCHTLTCFETADSGQVTPI